MDKAFKLVLIFPQPNHSIVRILISVPQMFQSKILHVFQLSDSAFNICEKQHSGEKNYEEETISRLFATVPFKGELIASTQNLILNPQSFRELRIKNQVTTLEFRVLIFED